MGEERGTASSPPATTTTALPTKVKPPTEGAAAPPRSPSTPGKGRLSTSVVPLHNNHSATASASPAPSAASAVPFAWEEHPGVPKANSKPPGVFPPPPDQPASTAPSPSPAAAKALPLPPPLCKHKGAKEAAGRAKKRPGTSGAAAAKGGQLLATDPFAAALVTCSRGDGVDEEESGRDKKGALVGYWRWGRRRPWGLLVGDRLGMASCMHSTPAGAVMDSTVRVPRHTNGPGRRPPLAAAAAASSSSCGRLSQAAPRTA